MKARGNGGERGRGGVGGDEGAYVVEGDFFQCFWSFLHLEVQRLQDSEHASDIVLPKVESVCVEVLISNHKNHSRPFPSTPCSITHTRAW